MIKVCIAGQRRIAVEICDYIRTHWGDVSLYALPNNSDKGIDGWQPSFLKYIRERDDIIQLTSIEDVYAFHEIIFLSLECDKIINPKKICSEKKYNLHFSLLPKYRGVYTSAWPIINEEHESGVTLHYIDKGIDTGNIIAQRKFPIYPNETAESLYSKYMDNGIKLVISLLPQILSTTHVPAIPQIEEDASYYSRKSINYHNPTINFSQSAKKISAWIRALYFPVFQLPQVHNYEISNVQITNHPSVFPPGTLIDDTSEHIIVATQDMDVILTKHKPNSNYQK